MALIDLLPKDNEVFLSTDIIVVYMLYTISQRLAFLR